MTLLAAIRNILLLFVLFLHSCISRKDDHPEHFERFFDQLKAEPFYYKYPPILDSLGSAIHRFPAGTGDKARYYLAKLSYHLSNTQYDTTFIYIDSLETTIRNRTDEERFRNMQREVLLIKSKCYQSVENYEEAMKYLLEAGMLRPENDKCFDYTIMSRTAGMLYQQGRFLLAAQYYLKMFANAPSCYTKDELFMTRQGCLDNAGLCYTAVGMYDSAMFYYNATLDQLKLFENKVPERANFIGLARGVVYANIANIKAINKDFETAEALSLASIKATEHEYLDFTLNTRLQLANAYLTWGKPDKADKVLHAIDSLYDFRLKGAHEEKRMEWTQAMRTLSEKTGNLAKAYAYGDKYISIRDSLDMIRKRDIARDVGKEFENMEQRTINTRLEALNRKKSFEFSIASLAALLAAAVGVFIWYNLQRSSRYAKELEQLNVQVEEKNEDLMQAFSSLEESHAENTRMTRMVAHDLKNPIGGIRTLVYSLMAKTPSEELKKMLELIYSTCNNSINTINELLKDKGSLTSIKKEMVDLRRLIEYCVELLQTKSEEKKQELHFVSGDAIFIHANREKIWRVMSNLISNAIKFSPENSTIDIKLEKKTQSAILSVKDEGIGIPENLRDKIFTNVSEASRTGTAGEESHGLGLSIAQQIVAEHHGKIWFDCGDEKGCTFYVELPLN